MRAKVENFLRTQLADDPVVASTLMIFSLNGPYKRQNASEILQKYLRNLIEYPDESKYHRIRVNNKIFQVIYQSLNKIALSLTLLVTNSVFYAFML